MKFPKMGRGGGQRPFGLFPKKHPNWGIHTPLSVEYLIQFFSLYPKNKNKGTLGSVLNTLLENEVTNRSESKETFLPLARKCECFAKKQ